MTLEGISLVAFDADDTLWHSEDLFAAAHDHLAEALGIPRISLDDALGDLEHANVAVFGFGAKSFALSAIEFAGLHASPDRLPGVIALVLADCRAMLSDPVRMIGTPDSLLDTLRSRGYSVAVITKGDYLVQSRRLQESGLVFDRSAIVEDKNSSVYDGVFRDWGVPAQAVCMVGNSVRSDVLPVLDLGGAAVHVPYPFLWRNEHAELPSSGRVRQIAELVELLELLP